MVKNLIPAYTTNTALLTEIKKLEQEFEQLKITSQAPSIYDTEVGVAYFSLSPPVSYAGFLHSVVATLTPASGTPILFAIPLISLYLTDYDDYNNLFPYANLAGTTTWANATYQKYEHIVDFNWWYSWGLTNNSNLVAIATVRRDDQGAIGITESDNNPNGATTGTINLAVVVQWRYIRPGVA